VSAKKRGAVCTLAETTGSSEAFADATKSPRTQINRAELAEGIDTFIRRH